MAFKDIRDRASVLKAVAEYDELGREAFLEKYGFSYSRQYFLVVNNKRYDSKPIIAAAHRFEYPDIGPLENNFSGGEQTVQKKLEQMGFHVMVLPDPNAAIKPSSRLAVGNLYSRDDLKRLFGIKDATIRTGIFHPKGTQSVWLFVTENKASDMTQYVDKLDGDVLHMQGQIKGRTDNLIVEHQMRDMELLLFYRKSKIERPHGGFVYEGPFRYVTHKDAHPTSFVLHRVGGGITAEQIAAAEAAAEAEHAYDPKDQNDARKKTLAAIVRRQGQPTFRKALLQAYGGRCAITECDFEPTLEAAHITPYLGAQTNHITNGLLLRADIHTLFDLGYLAVDTTTMTLVITGALKRTIYKELGGKILRLPSNPKMAPSKTALDEHRKAAAL